MAISNQMLVGTGCLIVIALVVATQYKEDTDIEMGEGGGGGGDTIILTDSPIVEDITLAIRSPADDAPTLAHVQQELRAIIDLHGRWNIVKSGFPSLNDLAELRAELIRINTVAQHIFLQRRPFFPNQDLGNKRIYDNHVGQILTEIEARRRQLSAEVPVTQLNRVPVNAGVPKPTILYLTAPDFSQESQDEPALTGDIVFEQTSSDLNDMVDEFAGQEEGAKTVSPKESGFRQADDSLNVPEEESEGANKRAAEEDADGLNEKTSPALVIASEPSKVAEINDDPTGDFESAADPPPSQPPKAHPPVTAAIEPTHEEVLLHQTNAVGDPAFNSTDDKTFEQDDDLDGYERIDNLKEARKDEEDPEQQAEMDQMIQDTEPEKAKVTSAIEDSSYKRLTVQLESYVEAIGRIEQQVNANNGGPGSLTLVKQYVKYITQSKTINRDERLLRADTLAFAEGGLMRIIERLGAAKTPKRAREDSGLAKESGGGVKKPRKKLLRL